MKQTYRVTGMSCAACSARVERAVGKVPGVASCVVSLLTNSMQVEGEAESSAVIAAVEKAGYEAALAAGEASGTQAAPAADLARDEEGEREISTLKCRLGASLLFLGILLYFSMGHMLWNWPLPHWFDGNHTAMGLAQLLLSGIVLIINQKFFISGARALLHRAPNMDTLVALGAGAAFGYSTCALFAMTNAQAHGGTAAAVKFMNEFHFESAAMIVTLITVGKLLEARAKGKTTSALKSLAKLAPTMATLWHNGEERRVPVAQIKVGDLFVVRPGEQFPVDGVVLEGTSAVNEAALTGESVPVDKRAGDSVSAATLNQSGFLRCQATRVGEDTALARIIRMVADAAADKAPIAKVADRVSSVFVPAIILIAIVTIVVWLLFGESVGFALARGIAVLVISCPCALGLATPVAIMVGSGLGARHGILFKTAAALEKTGRARTVVLDKTGTITTGEPQVTDILPAPGIDESTLLRLACALERGSEHPLARAIVRAAADTNVNGTEIPEIAENIEALPGRGLHGTYEGARLAGGNAAFIGEMAQVPSELREKAEQWAQSGKTPLFFSHGDKFLGIVAVADIIRQESAQAIRELHDMGLRVIMLTGDNTRTAQAIGAQAGVDEVIAEVLPQDKEETVRKLQAQAHTIMVGDGINDAPALTRAGTGIAIGAGTDVAIDAAEVVLVKNRLSDVPAAIRLSRATLRNIYQNLFWAFFYNALGIPLAAGVWIKTLGWQLSPMFGAAAMSLSSFCVVSNALRLNLCKLYPGEPSPPKEETMEKTLKIEGMMCGHCEARVKQCLEALPEVAGAVVSHEKGTAVLTLKQDIADSKLKQIVEEQGYKVL